MSKWISNLFITYSIRSFNLKNEISSVITVGIELYFLIPLWNNAFWIVAFMAKVNFISHKFLKSMVWLSKLNLIFLFKYCGACPLIHLHSSILNLQSIQSFQFFVWLLKCFWYINFEYFVIVKDPFYCKGIKY